MEERKIMTEWIPSLSEKELGWILTEVIPSVNKYDFKAINEKEKYNNITSRSVRENTQKYDRGPEVCTGCETWKTISHL